MTTTNRAAKLSKAHKVLKKHYKPAAAAERPLLEHLLYACCLEYASFELADEAFARMLQTYFDWNEVRVTTVSELTEVMAPVAKASDAASRLKRTLQSVFEGYYSFDLEALKKENIGKAVAQLQKLDGISPFALAFATQHGLGGHSIAVSDDALEALRVLGIISGEEAQQRRVPGLERAIPKSKGIEFGSLLHQLGNDYMAAPFSSRVRTLMLEIAPDAKDRFPKRGAKKKEDGTSADDDAEDSAAGVRDVEKSVPAAPSEPPASAEVPPEPSKRKSSGPKKAPPAAKKEPSGQKVAKKKPR